MSYKARMHPKVSKGELQVFRALSGAGLTGGMITQRPIVLKATVPDFCWPEKRKIVYLDGLQVHSSDEQQEHDEEVRKLLEAQGWDVLRILYEPPLTDAKLEEVLETIRHFLSKQPE
ncbi:MAG: endonuclease domain-containing protein [Chloroflexota bacterium]|nr:DUF559 domain-containing protein [Candidatus Sulfotelmatobacter sp.]